MNPHTDANDTELLQRMLAGDEEALTTLYRRRQGGIYRFVMQMCGSRVLAEDVTQEVFIVLIRDAQTFDPARGSLEQFSGGRGSQSSVATPTARTVLRATGRR